jgi:hypothetical protein
MPVEGSAAVQSDVGAAANSGFLPSKCGRKNPYRVFGI